MPRHSVTLLLALVFILASHSFMVYLWTAPLPSNTGVWMGFRSIGISMSDFPLVLLLLLGFLILYNQATIASEVWAMAQAILRNYGGLWWLSLLVWTYLSSFWAREGALSRFDALHLLLELVAALAVSYYVSKGWEKLLLLAFIAAAVFQSILAILQLQQGQSLGLTWLLEPIRDVTNPFGYAAQSFRGYGLERHPNMLAGMLFLAIFAALLLWKSAWVKAAIAVLILGLVASLARNMIVIGLLSLFLLILLEGTWSKKRLLLSALSILALICLGILLFGQQIWVDFQERSLFYLQYPPAFFERLTFAHADTIAVWQKSPLLGVGAGNLALEIGYLRAGYYGLLLPVHNVFLFILAELGIFGFVSFFMGLSALWGQAKATNRREIQILAVAVIGLSLASCFDFYFWDELRWRSLFFLWLGLYWGYRFRASASSSA